MTGVATNDPIEVAGNAVSVIKTAQTPTDSKPTSSSTAVDIVETDTQKKSRLQRERRARQKTSLPPAALRAVKDRRNSTAKAARARQTPAERAAVNAARKAKMTAEQREAHAAANRIANMSDEAIARQNERNAGRRQQNDPNFGQSSSSTGHCPLSAEQDAYQEYINDLY